MFWKTLSYSILTKCLNPFKSKCSTIWNLLVGEKDVNGALVALILEGSERLSIAVLKSIMTAY